MLRHACIVGVCMQSSCCTAASFECGLRCAGAVGRIDNTTEATFAPGSPSDVALAPTLYPDSCDPTGNTPGDPDYQVPSSFSPLSVFLACMYASAMCFRAVKFLAFVHGDKKNRIGPSNPEGFRVAGAVADSHILCLVVTDGCETKEEWKDGVRVQDGAPTTTNPGAVDDAAPLNLVGDHRPAAGASSALAVTAGYGAAPSYACMHAFLVAPSRRFRSPFG